MRGSLGGRQSQPILGKPAEKVASGARAAQIPPPLSFIERKPGAIRPVLNLSGHDLSRTQPPPPTALYKGKVE